MMKALLASFALAALPAAALSQSAGSGDWNVGGNSLGCMAHTSLPQGTVVSVIAGRGQESLLFVVQNKGWSSLEDGSVYPLAVQLDGQSPFEFKAVAKTELDGDGPGLFFSVQPGEEDGKRFIEAFARSAGMSLGQNGRSLASLRLSGGSSAMTALAQCMSHMWSGGEGDAEEIVGANGKSVSL